MLHGDVGKMNYVHCRRGMLLAWGTMISNEYNIDEYINKGKGKSIVCRRNREWKRDFSCARKNSPLTTKGTASHQQTVDTDLPVLDTTTWPNAVPAHNTCNKATTQL
ncbi:hypothetical protein PHYBLDRAFT_141993 [Phycomyces blakesleeanus NRRL 1555(-)]|uniref:Uncharacterized protein n=1 Tax=Phycomyces blakesleeanus (strain ATCC 8743b / DSM 1359 / FGSC 10004 / NBRC 33097 / NRRL 1555) TaxID=763407 RepID=A0A167PKK5_PHYB8|nr:hypothetical protein PHYBLDRAFT_141993 [Phycomyces blakesleeanus NRRL 1555(-)]OAD78126.1 hypothetical protein PHYBLDRAFT_141993 [Phycomyces blakesleeanus NRRL 1555(-)]|eukprot:XP_018296166.1 hypothetical protein PHYBLDRAFT_141993 [Phycomyces blakesleeanus NRRL 1555(-)]